jgi:predicted RNA-binding Zn-ribbon protein involved in translation (DUF1610 family)
MAATCPQCDAVISHLNIQEMTSSALLGPQWRTIAFLCPMCQKILSIQIDPIAIKNDIINAIKPNRI